MDKLVKNGEKLVKRNWKHENRETSAKKIQTCEKKITKSDKVVKNNYITEQKLVNSNNPISKIITKSKYLDQDAGDGL